MVPVGLVNLEAGQGVPVEKMSGLEGRRVEAIVRIVRGKKVSGLNDRRVAAIVHSVRVETVSGLIGRVVPVVKVIVRTVHGKKVSDLKDRGDLGSARDERGKTVSGLKDRGELESDLDARGKKVSDLEDRGGNSIAPHDLSVAIDPNDLLPMRNVELMKFVAPKASVSTRVARFHTSVPPKNGGSMRARFVRASRRSEANKSQFANGRVKQWRPSTREPWGPSPLHSVNVMDSSRRVA